MHREIGMLTAKVDMILEGVRRSEEKSDISRASMHRRMDEIAERVGKVEGNVDDVKEDVSEMKPVIDASMSKCQPRKSLPSKQNEPLWRRIKSATTSAQFRHSSIKPLIRSSSTTALPWQATKTAPTPIGPRRPARSSHGAIRFGLCLWAAFCCPIRNACSADARRIHIGTSRNQLAVRLLPTERTEWIGKGGWQCCHLINWHMK